MSNVVVRIADYRARRAHDTTPCPTEYNAAVKWAGHNFDRLVEVCKARGFRPGWIVDRVGGRTRLTQEQADAISRMKREAGPNYFSHRLRWLLYRLAEGATADQCIEAARSATPYADCKYVAYCVRNDLLKLEDLQIHDALAQVM